MHSKLYLCTNSPRKKFRKFCTAFLKQIFLLMTIPTEGDDGTHILNSYDKVHVLFLAAVVTQAANVDDIYSGNGTLQN